MLVVISDIHFVDGTAGEHNLHYSAFQSVFLSDIATLAKDNEAKEVKILLLGDIVDLIRSSQWFDVEISDRPWGGNGLLDVSNPRPKSQTEIKALEIFGKVPEKDLSKKSPPKSLPKNTILYKNWETFKLFRDFRKHLVTDHQVDIPVEIIYVPGNHDRLCNLYPSLRAAVQKSLGVTLRSTGSSAIQGDPEGVWSYRNDYMDESYGVYARHGHQFDIWNFDGDSQYDSLGHLKVPVGDVITTEFAVKIPWKLEKLSSKYQDITPELINNVKDIDNVRPLSRVMEWIYYRVKNDSGMVRKAFDQAFDEVVTEMLDIELIQRWRSPETHVDEALRAMSSRWLKWIPKFLVDRLDAEDMLHLLIGLSGRPHDPDKDPFATSAYNESIWRTNNRIRFILYGHTHVPVQRPLDAVGDREILYLNTGTWRTRIVKTVGLDTVPDFIGMKQMTYSIFYREDEDNNHKEPGTISFDVWTGTKKKTYD
jgi:UDP-2,3-diacylglucosamine pyrophosphatase LpxH